MGTHDSPRPRSHAILLLVLLGPLPFVAANPTVADQQAAPDWGTYYGEDGNRSVQALAAVPEGVAITLGRFGDADSGMEALVRFDTAGNVLWSAFYGGKPGQGEGTVRALASVPSSDSIYVAGYTTYETGIATAGAHQSARECFAEGGCGSEGFIAQFDGSGALRWGTYLGGPDDEYVYDASANGTGELYVCGETESATGLATAGAHQSVLPADGGGFVAKFGVGGDLQWATYYDGPCSIVAADPNGNGVVIGGWTGQPGDFVTEGALQPDPVGGNDAYLARFDAAGKRQWGSYFGEGHAFVHELELDGTGAVYAVGATDEHDPLITSGAHQEDYGGGTSDLYIARLTPTGERQWGTYFGGDSFERHARAAVDAAGNLYFSASTSSDDLATSGAPNSTIGERTDVIVGKVRADGGLDWAVYYGGEADEHAGALAVDPDGRIYLGGLTQSQSGIATPGAHRAERRGEQNAFVAMLRS